MGPTHYWLDGKHTLDASQQPCCLNSPYHTRHFSNAFFNLARLEFLKPGRDFRPRQSLKFQSFFGGNRRTNLFHR